MSTVTTINGSDTVTSSRTIINTNFANLNSTKKEDSMTTNKILGRNTAGTGAIEEIILGTNLSMTGTTLNVTAGSGDMLLASTQTNSGLKNFLNGTLGIRNLTNSFSGFFSFTNNGADATFTLPLASDTLVGRAVTETLTNKTLTSPVLTTPSLGVATATSINGATITSGTLNGGTNTGDETTARINTLYGATVPTISSTSTLTNKRISKRVVVITQAAAPAINTDNGDIFQITGLAQAITSLTTNLTGTPSAGDMFELQITDTGTARAITPGASFANTTVTHPTTTVISTMVRILYQRNNANTVWDCIAVV